MNKQTKTTESQKPLTVIITIFAILLIGIVALLVHLSTSKHASTGYKITPPDGWSKVQPTPKGALAAYVDTTGRSGNTPTFKAFIGIQSSPVDVAAVKKMTPQQISDSYIEQISKSYTNYNQLALSQKTIEGEPAVFVTFSSLRGTSPITTDSLFVIKKGTSYSVNGEALSSDWPRFSKDIKQSVLSFRP